RGREGFLRTGSDPRTSQTGFLSIRLDSSFSRDLGPPMRRAFFLRVYAFEANPVQSVNPAELAGIVTGSEGCLVMATC
ncbi:MAG: hypothetical protein ACREVT_14875, partial [Burkholderiales bacterium]